MLSSLLNFGTFVCFAKFISRYSNFISKTGCFRKPNNILVYLIFLKSRWFLSQLQLPYLYYLELPPIVLQNYLLCESLIKSFEAKQLKRQQQKLKQKNKLLKNHHGYIYWIYQDSSSPPIFPKQGLIHDLNMGGDINVSSRWRITNVKNIADRQVFCVLFFVQSRQICFALKMSFVLRHKLY